MKAIKKAGKIIIYFNESNHGMQELIDRYIDTGYKIITILPYPTCHQSGWIDQWEKNNE